MPPEWKLQLGRDDLQVHGEVVIVHFQGGRSQRVRMTETSDAWHFSSTCARGRDVIDTRELPERIWWQNAEATLVGFRIDSSNRLVGEVVLPKAGLSADELAVAIRLLARECDRMEFAVTGKDVE